MPKLIRRLLQVIQAAGAITAALWLRSVAAHNGEEHGASASGWAGRVDDVLLGGAILAITGLVYWLANFSRDDQAPDSDASADKPH